MGLGTAILLAGLGGAGALLVQHWVIRSRASRRLWAEPARGDADTPPARPEITGRVHHPIWIASGLGAGVLAAALWGRPGIASGLGALAGSLVYLVQAARAQRRDIALEEGLADALGLVGSALRAGASPTDALERAGLESPEPLGSLLQELAARLRKGAEAGAVLRELAERVPLDSFRLFAASLAIQWQAGGSLGGALALVGRSVRDRAELLRRIETQAGPTRASVLVLMAANGAVALLAWSQDPVNVGSFLDGTTGAWLVGGALWSQALCLQWMWRLSRVAS